MIENWCTPSRGLMAAALLPALLALPGCGGMKQALGMAKSTPDEFAIVTQAPLVIPPDFNLTPPGSRTAGSQRNEAQTIASQALMGDKNAYSADMSAGEKALVTDAGAQYADPLIREVVDQDFADVSRRSEGFSNKLIFNDKSQAADKPIDARAEADRLSQESETPNGAPPPTIKKSGSTFDDLF